MIDIWTVVVGIIVMLVVVGGLLYLFYSRTNAVQKTGYGAIIMLAVVSIMIPIFWIAETGNEASAKADQFKTAVQRGQDLYAHYCITSCYRIEKGKLVNPTYNGYTIAALNQMTDAQIMNIIAGGVYNPSATPQPTKATDVPRSDMYDGPLDANDVQYLLFLIRSADPSYLSKNGYPSYNGFDSFVQYAQANYPSAYSTASAPPPSAADVFGKPVDMTSKKAVTINIGDTLPANAPKNVDCSVGCYQMLNVKVKVGTTITWVNESKVAHTVTAIQGLSLAANPAANIFDSKIASPIAPKGGKFSYTVTMAAYNLNSKDHVVFYYCQIHPTTMFAELTIVP